MACSRHRQTFSCGVVWCCWSVGKWSTSACLTQWLFSECLTVTKADNILYVTLVDIGPSAYNESSVIMDHSYVIYYTFYANICIPLNSVGFLTI